MKFNNSHVNLDEIEEFTIAHYEDNAESFRVGTKDHDVSQNIDAFLSIKFNSSPLTFSKINLLKYFLALTWSFFIKDSIPNKRSASKNNWFSSQIFLENTNASSNFSSKISTAYFSH